MEYLRVPPNSQIQSLSLRWAPDRIDVTPRLEYDYRFHCYRCGTISYSYAHANMLEARDGLPVPSEYKAVLRVRRLVECDEDDWSDECYETDIMCPSCRNERLDREVIGGPFPTRRIYQEVGKPYLSGVVEIDGIFQASTLNFADFIPDAVGQVETQQITNRLGPDHVRTIVSVYGTEPVNLGSYVA